MVTRDVCCGREFVFLFWRYYSSTYTLMRATSMRYRWDAGHIISLLQPSRDDVGHFLAHGPSSLRFIPFWHFRLEKIVRESKTTAWLVLSLFSHSRFNKLIITGGTPLELTDCDVDIYSLTPQSFPPARQQNWKTFSLFPAPAIEISNSATYAWKLSSTRLWWSFR